MLTVLCTVFTLPVQSQGKSLKTPINSQASCSPLLPVFKLSEAYCSRCHILWKRVRLIPRMLNYSFRLFPLSIKCFYFMYVGCCVFLYLYPLFPDIYLCPSSSPFCFWPGLSLLHSHCIQQILESVNHCHINGIVHRDLKVSKWWK